MPENFEARPPKSPEQIGKILKSIHAANEKSLAGPYTGGLPASQRKRLSAPKAHSKAASVRPGLPCTELLLWHGAFVGGLAGLLLGLNLGLALLIVTVKVHGLWLVVPAIAAGCNWAGGRLVARHAVVRQHPCKVAVSSASRSGHRRSQSS